MFYGESLMRQHSVTVSLPRYSHLDVYGGQQEGLVSVLGPGVEALPVRQACNRQHNTWCLVIKRQACNRQHNTWCLVIKRQACNRQHNTWCLVSKRQTCNRQHNTWCLVSKRQTCNRQHNTWCLVI